MAVFTTTPAPVDLPSPDPVGAPGFARWACTYRGVHALVGLRIALTPLTMVAMRAGCGAQQTSRRGRLHVGRVGRSKNVLGLQEPLFLPGVRSGHGARAELQGPG